METITGGGAFTRKNITDLNANFAETATLVGTETLNNKTLTAPVINGAVTGTSFGSRTVKYGALSLTGAALHAAVQSWANPEGAAIIVLRATLNITTQSSGASTMDVGVTAVSATTSSDTLLDGVSGAAAALCDSMDATLDSGANAKAQGLASGKWVTVAEASGDVTGLVATLLIEYVLA